MLLDDSKTSSIQFLNNKYISENLYGRELSSQVFITASDLVMCGSTLFCGTGVQSAKYDVMSKFDATHFTPGVTMSYNSSTEDYDRDTHKWLGNYLRWYRDCRGIDLMPLYNCFAGEDTTFVHIKDHTIQTGRDDSHYVWVVPVDLNKTYTVCVESSNKISIGGTFINKFGRLECHYDNKKYLDELLTSPIYEVQSTNYSLPISFSSFTSDSRLLAHNNDFYMIIQSETTRKPSIVVTECDYYGNNVAIITNAECVQGVDYSQIEYPVYSSLVTVPTNFNVPYSDRLIEYLTENVISSVEDIPNNVSRVSEAIDMPSWDDSRRDVWSPELRYRIYNTYFKYTDNKFFKGSQVNFKHDPTDKERVKSIPEEYKVMYDNQLVGLKNCKLLPTFETKYDILGFVDKDIENYLFKYRGVS